MLHVPKQRMIMKWKTMGYKITMKLFRSIIRKKKSKNLRLIKLQMCYGLMDI